MYLSCIHWHWLNLNNNEMNRRLEIDISSEHEEYGSPEYRPPDEQSEKEEQEEEEEEQDEQEEESEEGEPSQYSQHNPHSSVSPSGQGNFESVQTFGNHPPTSTDRHFVDRLLHSRPNFSPPSLNETPIGQRAAQHRREGQSIEDEVARIISKVKRSHGGEQAEERTRIGMINKQLLKENTDIIGEINQLQSKLEGLCSRHSKNKKNKQAGSQALAGKAQRYKEKLSRALALNGKLSSRLVTEKSRSQVISSTFRSVLNQASSSHISTLRSHVRGESNEMVRSKKSTIPSQRQEPPLCARCCKELGEKDPVSMRSKEANQSFKEGMTQRSKELMFSPVLQFKNYEIAGEKSSLLELPRRTTRQVHCQVNFQETAALEQLRALQEEEILLQASIEANNRRILEFQELLYQLVDLT